ncbi:MAG TPA: serine/threonine-protein kinase [Kofleriaceae bacterium]|nr:serine/threonine-protein kinase [Kofleriaceae bacterium]
MQAGQLVIRPLLGESGRKVSHARELREHDRVPLAKRRPRVGSRYRLGPKLGAGGMAEVFRGTLIGTQGFARPVAIKRVRADHPDAARFAAMLIEEARIASQLSHPNVVAVLDFDRDPEDKLFLVMELVDGKDLEALCKAARPPAAVAMFVVSEILRGIGYAHELPHGGAVRGYVHRDLSPSNVLVSWEGAVKVTDFGVAKALERSGVAQIDSGKGKPAYMSPEQLRTEPLDGRSDLFAVGIILWELLTGVPLFGGATREVFAQILFRDVPRPSQLATGVPADLEAVVMKLLAREREDRYPTAEAAIEDLTRCADHPRDGRGELVRWIRHRFPPAARARAARTRRAGEAAPRGGGQDTKRAAVNAARETATDEAW